MGHRVGIDLGTTNSLIAYTELDSLQCMKLEGDAFPMAVFASCVGLDPYGGLVYGTEARGLPESVSAFKRHIGSDTEWTLGGKTYNAVQLSALLLAEMKARFEEHHGPIESAVITVPANFTDRQRHETREAGRIAGLHVSRIINEPSAAAIAYSLSDLPPGENAVVIDWGGGTLDVSVLDCLESVLDIRANDGDPTCGGNDVDDVILSLVEERLASSHGDVLRDPAVRRELSVHCEAIKIHLSEALEWNEPIQLRSRGLSLDFALTRRELEERIEPLVDRVLRAARRCLEKAPEGAIDPHSVTDVILVGGSCRIPLLQRRVQEYFGQGGRMDLDHLEVVSLGAAYQAEHATEAGDLITLHSLATSLGVECTGTDPQGVVRRNLFQVILPAGAKLPARATHKFFTVHDDQEAIQISIHETERATVEGLQPWDTRYVSDLPPAPAGACPILVTFEYGLEQMLRVVVEIEELGVREEWIAKFRKDLDEQRPASAEKVVEARTGSLDALVAFRDRARHALADAARDPHTDELMRALDEALENEDLPAGMEAKRSLAVAIFDRGLNLA